jgi:ribulose-phosphate 3-epimerase
MVLLMSVNPGFGGQKFIANTTQKVRDLKALIARKNAHAIIEVDGGVNQETGKLLAEAGCDAVVAGSAVFRAADPQAEILALKNLNDTTCC